MLQVGSADGQYCSLSKETASMWTLRPFGSPWRRAIPIDPRRLADIRSFLRGLSRHHQRKDVADFTRVVEQIGILERGPAATVSRTTDGR